jgi:hypothetical protein
MKTVKTANGFKKIEDWNLDLVPVQLRTILQEHRATLIDKIMNNGLASYVDYKFNIKIPTNKMDGLKLNLENLKNSGIDVNKYSLVFDTVLKNEFTSLDNAIFYGEIDSSIRSNIFEPQLFPQARQIFLQ